MAGNSPAGRAPSRDLAGVYTACGFIGTSVTFVPEGNALPAHYAEQARFHHGRAAATLDEIEAPRALSLPPAQRQALLTRALEEERFACRLLLRPQQESRSYRGTSFELRRAQWRGLVESLEQQLYRLVR